MTRKIMHLLHHDPSNTWHLDLGGTILATFNTKQEGISVGTRRGSELESAGELAQLVIHRADGSIQMEYIYGKATAATRSPK